MKKSKANSIAQILPQDDLLWLSALYIAKENWLRVKLLNIPSTRWYFTHGRETSLLQLYLLSSPWTIGNFRASSSVTVFKALPTIQLLVSCLKVYIQLTRAMMFGLQRYDNAKRAKISVLFISIIIVKNINPELYAGCFYLIVELNVSQRKRVLSPKSNQKQNKTNNNNNNMDGEYKVTIDTNDFFMLLETFRCRPFYQNTEEEGICKIARCSSCRFFVVVDLSCRRQRRLWYSSLLSRGGKRQPSTSTSPNKVHEASVGSRVQ